MMSGKLLERCKSNLVARALYENVADAPDELTFVKGDLLTVLEQNTGGLSGWWLCALRGRQGIAPGNRLRLLPGTYDPTGLGYSMGAPSVSEPTGLDHQQTNGDQVRRRSWHANPNKVVLPQKIGDVYVYDVPASMRSVDEVDACQRRILLRNPMGSGASLDSSYDTPTSNRSIIKASYPTYDEPRVHSQPAYDVPKSHHSTSSSHDYDVPPEEQEYDFPVRTIAAMTYDVPLHSKQQLTTRSDNYVVPPSRTSNRSSGVSVFSGSSSSSLSGSQSSLNASLSLSSLCGSNRSSLEQAPHELYDIPPSETRRVQAPPSPSLVYDTPPAPRSVNRPIPNVMDGVYDVPPQVTRDVKLEEGSPADGEDNNRRQSSEGIDGAMAVSGKELPIALDAAMEVLVNRQQEVHGSISKLFVLVGSSSSLNRKDTSSRACELKAACHKLRTTMADFVTFSQSALANSTHAADRGLSHKLGKLLVPLLDSNMIVQKTTRSLDDRGWQMTTDEASSEDLERLVACARSLVEEVRHVASFIQGNSPLIFKRAQLISEQQQRGLQDRPLPPVPAPKSSSVHPCAEDDETRPNDYDYVSLETKEAVEKENAEIKATLPQELRKSFENLLIQSEIPVQEKSCLLHTADLQLLQFYAIQAETHAMYLDNAIEAFFQAVKGNQLPKVFISHSKFVVISAHKLVYIGDSVQRNVGDSKVRSEVSRVANGLCEGLKTLVRTTKAAAVKFPSVEAVQEMVDSVVDISHIAKELRLCMTHTVKL